VDWVDGVDGGGRGVDEVEGGVDGGGGILKILCFNVFRKICDKIY
jgi:hypothetical protein